MPALLFLPVDTWGAPTWVILLAPLLAFGIVALGGWLLWLVPATRVPRSDDPQRPLTAAGESPLLERPATVRNRVTLGLVVALLTCGALGYLVAAFGRGWGCERADGDRAGGPRGYLPGHPCGASERWLCPSSSLALGASADPAERAAFKLATACWAAWRCWRGRSPSRSSMATGGARWERDCWSSAALRRLRWRAGSHGAEGTVVSCFSAWVMRRGDQRLSPRVLSPVALSAVCSIGDAAAG